VPGDAKTDDQTAKGCGCLVGLVVIIAIVVVISSGGGSKSSTPNHVGPYVASGATIPAIVEEAISEEDGATGLNGTPHGGCPQHICEIAYTVKEPVGISQGLELVQPTRAVFKRVFTDRSVKTVEISVSGPTESVGGKQGTSVLFRLTCSREDGAQIDWSRVTAKGMETICDFERVSL
jgi:hypothetical protein